MIEAPASPNTSSAEEPGTNLYRNCTAFRISMGRLQDKNKSDLIIQVILTVVGIAYRHDI
jgi:hypothetical protein